MSNELITRRNFLKLSAVSAVAAGMAGLDLTGAFAAPPTPGAKGAGKESREKNGENVIPIISDPKKMKEFSIGDDQPAFHTQLTGYEAQIQDMVLAETPTATSIVTFDGAAGSVVDRGDAFVGFTAFAQRKVKNPVLGDLTLVDGANGLVTYTDGRKVKGKLVNFYTFSNWYELPQKPINPTGAFMVMQPQGTFQIGFMDGNGDPYFSKNYVEHSVSPNVGVDHKYSFTPEGYPVITGTKGKFAWKDGNWVDLNAKELKPDTSANLSAEAKSEVAKFTSFNVLEKFPAATFHEGRFVVGKTEQGQDIVLVPEFGGPFSQESLKGYEKGVDSIDGLHGLRAELKTNKPEDYQAVLVGTLKGKSGQSVTVLSDQQGMFSSLAFSDAAYWSKFMDQLVEQKIMKKNQHLNVVFGGQDMEVAVLSGRRNPDVKDKEWIELFNMDTAEAPYYQVGVKPGIGMVQEEGSRWFYINPDKETIVIRPPWIAAAINNSLQNGLNLDERISVALEYYIWDGMLHGVGVKNGIAETDIVAARKAIYKALGTNKGVIDFTPNIAHPQIVAAGKIYEERYPSD